MSEDTNCPHDVVREGGRGIRLVKSSEVATRSSAAARKAAVAGVWAMKEGGRAVILVGKSILVAVCDFDDAWWFVWLATMSMKESAWSDFCCLLLLLVSILRCCAGSAAISGGLLLLVPLVEVVAAKQPHSSPLREVLVASSASLGPSLRDLAR